jgi:hypothetical protein
MLRPRELICMQQIVMIGKPQNIKRGETLWVMHNADVKNHKNGYPAAQ